MIPNVTIYILRDMLDLTRYIRLATMLVISAIHLIGLYLLNKVF
jgi:hypothetical protein